MKKILALIIIIILVLAGVSHYQKSRLTHLFDSVSDQEKQANILVWQYTDFEDHGQIFTLGSAALIYRENTTYYALSAYHIIEDDVDGSYRYLNDGYNQSHHFGSVEEFKSASTVMEVVDFDVEKDLVLFRFDLDEDLHVFELAEKELIKKDLVVVVSNPEGSSDIISVGRVKSNRIREIEYEDGTAQSGLMVHDAAILAGSSGSAVLNHNLKLAGINLATNSIRLNVSGKPVNLNAYYIPLAGVKEFLKTTELKTLID